MKVIEPALYEKISSLINQMEYEYVGAEWAQEDGRQFLRIYIDHPKGIMVDDCARVTHQLKVFYPGALEVSSPGIDRPLFEIAHYQQQLGQRVNLKLRSPLQKRRRWVGVLLRIDDENQIYILADQGEIVIPFSSIEKANIIADIRL